MSYALSPEEWVERFPGIDTSVVEIPEGWTSLVVELLEALAKVPGWAPSNITQIKEKYGGLRLHYDGYTVVREPERGSADYEALEHVIAIYEQRSWSTCQKCGAEGATQVNVKAGWSLTVPPSPGPICTLCSACKTAAEAT